MQKWAPYVLVAVLVVILAVWWLVASLSAPAPAPAAQAPAQQPNPSSQEISYTPDPSAPLAVNESASGTTYTYSGSIPTRATCENITSGISGSIDGSTANLTLTIRLLYTGGACSTADPSATPQKFSLSYSYNGKGKVTPKLTAVYVNETSVPFTLTTK